MKLNLSVEELTQVIFTETFSKDQIEKMIAVDLSEQENDDVVKIPFHSESNYTISDQLGKEYDEYTTSDESKESNLILASYQFMKNSPGVIRIFKDPIKIYLHHLIKQTANAGSLGLNTALYALFFIIEELIVHQSFHHFCDVKRQLTGAAFSKDIEEQLAVAHSYNSFALPSFPRAFNIRYPYLYEKILRRVCSTYLLQKIQFQNCGSLDVLMTKHFNSYEANCYKNWHLHTHSSCYRTDYYNYVKNGQMDRLLNSGVPINNIFDEIQFISNEGTVIILV